MLFPAVIHILPFLQKILLFRAAVTDIGIVGPHHFLSQSLAEVGVEEVLVGVPPLDPLGQGLDLLEFFVVAAILPNIIIDNSLK